MKANVAKDEKEEKISEATKVKFKKSNNLLRQNRSERKGFLRKIVYYMKEGMMGLANDIEPNIADEEWSKHSLIKHNRNQPINPYIHSNNTDKTDHIYPYTTPW